jgi:hypothetical protein
MTVLHGCMGVTHQLGSVRQGQTLGSVTPAQYINGSVTPAQYINGSVTPAQYINGSVTPAQYINGSTSWLHGGDIAALAKLAGVTLFKHACPRTNL